jgi:hypothetical protein
MIPLILHRADTSLRGCAPDNTQREQIDGQTLRKAYGYGIDMG